MVWEIEVRSWYVRATFEVRCKIPFLIEKHELVVDEEKTNEVIDNIAGDYDDPEQVKNYYRNNEQELSQIKHIALEDMVVELVLKTASVTTRRVSYSEAVSRDSNYTGNSGSEKDPN